MSYFKVRVGGKYVTKAFLFVTGIRDDGCREILGAKIMDSENEGFRSGFFDELIDRGLKDVKLVVSDGHKEYKAQFSLDSWVKPGRRVMFIPATRC